MISEMDRDAGYPVELVALYLEMARESATYDYCHVYPFPPNLAL